MRTCKGLVQLAAALGQKVVSPSIALVGAIALKFFGMCDALAGQLHVPTNNGQASLAG